MKAERNNVIQFNRKMNNQQIIVCILIIHCVHKKRASLYLTATMANLNQFSQLLYYFNWVNVACTQCKIAHINLNVHTRCPVIIKYILFIFIRSNNNSVNFLGTITWSPIQGRPRSRWMEKKKWSIRKSEPSEWRQNDGNSTESQMTALLLVVCSMTLGWQLQTHDHQSWSSNVEPGDRQTEMRTSSVFSVWSVELTDIIWCSVMDSFEDQKTKLVSDSLGHAQPMISDETSNTIWQFVNVITHQQMKMLWSSH